MKVTINNIEECNQFSYILTHSLGEAIVVPFKEGNYWTYALKKIKFSTLTLRFSITSISSCSLKVLVVYKFHGPPEKIRENLYS